MTQGNREKIINIIRNKDIQQLIQENKWEKVFSTNVVPTELQSDFAEFLIVDCGINCLKGMRSIPKDFFNTTEIREITIPKEIYTINQSAFFNCDYLKYVEFEKDSECKYLGAQAFQGCNSLDNLKLPDNLEGMGAKCFVDCSFLSTIVIPKGIKYLIDNTFKGCTNLKSIEIENEDFKYLGNGVFDGCIQLKEIVFKGPSSKWRLINKEQGWRPVKQKITIKCDDKDIIYGE